MSAHFILERFERVDASPALTLLRLSGRWTAQPGPAAELVVGEQRFVPLPGPAADLTAWRGAYPVPVALLEANLEALALGTGLLLPAPVASSEPMPRTLAAQLAKALGDISALEAEAVLLERDQRRILRSHHEIEARAHELERRVAALEAELAVAPPAFELTTLAGSELVLQDEARDLELISSRERIEQLEEALRGVIAEEERHLARQAELELRLEQAERAASGAPIEPVTITGLDPYDDQPAPVAAEIEEELELLRVEVASLHDRAERGEAALQEAIAQAAATEDSAVLRTLVEELEHAVQVSSSECATLNDRLLMVTRERDEMAFQITAETGRRHQRTAAH